MTRDPSTPLRAALLLSIGLFGVYSRQWIATAVLCAVWSIGLSPLRFAADRMLQLASSLVAIAVAWLLFTFSALPVSARDIDVLGPTGQLVSLALLLATSLRLLITTPWGGVRASTALTLLALLFLADGQFDAGYIVTSLIVIGCLWRALWAADPARASWRDMDRPLRTRTALTCAIAAVTATGTALALPSVFPWLSRITLNMIDPPRSETGFATSMTLGALSGLRDNDVRVLRVHGAYVEHLRGIAYDAYRYGHWVQSDESSARDAAVMSASGAFTTEIESIGGDRARYFVPLAATSIAIASGKLRFDASGNFSAERQQRADRVRFRAGVRDRFAPLAPRAKDLQIPESVAPILRELAGQWTLGVVGDAARVAALATHLRDHYAYSLEFERDRGIDPVVDFLTRHRQGQCEYFASALALLARSIGVPARVIGGYRVHEHNDVGGYYVVRENDAHAWVEVWLPGTGWQTYDATPAAARAAKFGHTPPLAAAVDLLGYLLSNAIRNIAPRHAYAVAGLLLVGWFVARVVRWLKTRHLRARGDSAPEMPPALAQLLSALERSGLARGTHEPLERYAQRVAASPALGRAAEALCAYSAHRYGGHGVLSDVENGLSSAAESLPRSA